MTTTPHYLQPASVVTNAHQYLSDGIEISGWKIQARKKPILSQPELETFSAELGLSFLPEMLFGNNGLSCSHYSGLQIQFFAFDALKECVGEEAQKRSPVLQGSEKWGERGVAYSSKGELTKLDAYDWTFSTKYQGTFSSTTKEELIIEPTTEGLDTDLLRRTDPIKYYEDVVLFEDELHDNGVSSLNVRVRVMPTCFLVLLRHWLRVDMTMFTCFETRIFHKFGQDYIILDFQERHSSWADVLAQVSQESVRDTNLVYPLLELKSHTTKRILFPKTK